MKKPGKAAKHNPRLSPHREGHMISESVPLIFSADVVESLPVYYRCMAQHLANTGRAVIRNSEEETDGELV